jgi:outer membrane lipoprotein-sorting protein
MKSAAVFVFAALLSVGMLGSSAFADEPSVEDLVKAHIEALGGEEALGNIKTISRSGVMYIEGDFGEFEGDYFESTVVGKKYYRKVSMDEDGETTVWDGEKAWKLSSEDGMSDLEGDELDRIKASAQISPLLAHISESGAEGIKVVPDEKLEGRECHVLQAQDRDTKYYLDKESHLLVALSGTPENSDLGSAVVVTHFDGYKAYDGVQLPEEAATELMNGAFTIGFEFSETEVNVEIDDSIFEKPKS